MIINKYAPMIAGGWNHRQNQCRGIETTRNAPKAMITPTKKRNKAAHKT